MAVDYMEVLGALGSIVGKHPQTMGLLMQTYSLWNAHADEAAKIIAENQAATVKVTGPLDQVAIVMQLAAMHPNVSQLLLQTLAMWQTRIPDLIQVITEFQAAATAANKT